jgi:hypothetical protein
MEDTIDILLNNKATFDSFVYTDWKSIDTELEQRRQDVQLESKLNELFVHGLPTCMGLEPIMAMFRSLVSPNHEAYRFLMCADVMENLKPLFFEYSDDKYVDINASKHALGKLCFHRRMNKLQQPVVQYVNVLDMSQANGKRMSSLCTIAGQNFVQFHHNFFDNVFPKHTSLICDISNWLKLHGNKASEYYFSFLLLFVRHGVLFENFLFSKNEMSFNRQVILPALLRIQELTGYKPLIVALEPTELEGDAFWTSYNHAYIKYVQIDHT